MRVIAGKFKSRRFYPPADKWPTRPTTDFAKEGLYNTLMHRIDFVDAKILDLFGGTGSHSYECISRGCTDVTYVDQHGPCLRFVKEIIKKLDVEDCVRIVRSDVFKYIKHCGIQYDYIFAGPPYPLPNLSSLPLEIFKQDLLKEDGLLVVEHDNKHDFSKHEFCFKEKNYGQAIFSFFEKGQES
jgi:16S rRNA (guanine(966)-N(2))-methyltransferase RsmD